VRATAQAITHLPFARCARAAALWFDRTLVLLVNVWSLAAQRTGTSLGGLVDQEPRGIGHGGAPDGQTWTTAAAGHARRDRAHRPPLPLLRKPTIRGAPVRHSIT
jgi:hypothetical protein